MDRSTVVVTRQTLIAVEPARAWALIRDFNAMPAWNTSVRQSRIEDGPADRIGCQRVLVFDDGSVWTHQLNGLSDVDMKLQYSIVATPQPMKIPVWNYRAEMRVSTGPDEMQPAPGSTCTVEWSAQFETAHPEEMTRRASLVFESGFAGLQRRLTP